MKKKAHHFFAMLARMKYINRWGLMRNTSAENIQEHSLQVAMIAHALAIIHNKVFGGNVDADKIAVIGIFHDANEILTGDLPTPIKYYNPEIKKAYKDVETVSKTKLLSMLPEEMQEVYQGLLFAEEAGEAYRFVKAADKLAAYIKCLEEKKAGNTEFVVAEKATRNAVDEMRMPEADYFLEHFIEGFLLSLDELQ